MQNEEKQKIRYVAYIRKSSDREDAQTLSLGSQKRELEKIADRKNLKIVKYIEESASAYKIGRLGFNEMLEYIEAGKADGILVYHLTRIARNSFDGGRVIYLMDENYIKEIRMPEKGYYGEISDDKFMMQVHFAMAKKSSDDTSQFVKRDIQSKILKGEYPITAPVGYLNIDKFGRITGLRFDKEKQDLIDKRVEKEERKYKRIEVDPDYGPVIKDLYSKFGTGLYSIDSLRKESYQSGLCGQRSKKMLSKATLQKILSNPFYYGAIPWKGVVHQPNEFPKETRHEGIVSKKLFDKVQDILHNKSKPRKVIHNHKYTGLIRCGECGSMITAEVQKGHTYYRCSKKKRHASKCIQPYIREELLKKKMNEAIGKYEIPEKFRDWAINILNENNEEEQEKNQKIIEQQRRKLSGIEKQLSSLLKLKISPNNLNEEMITDEEYQAQKNELVKEKELINEKLLDTEQNASNWLEQCEEFFNFAVSCRKKFNEGSTEEKKIIFTRIFGSNVSLYNKKLLIKAEKTFFETASLTNSYNWRGRPGSNRRPHA
ncbi:MAG: recombinase family protein [Patescibacteria group bacterium]